MPITLIVEIALSVLLIATVGYCAVLERRLSALRKGQDGLKQTIAELNAAIAGADASMRSLKTNAAAITGKLDEGISRGRSVADELAMLTASGDRIAARMERAGTNPAPRSNQPSHLPSSLANRLDALRPQAARNVR